MSDEPQPQPNEPGARAPDGTLNPAGTPSTTTGQATTTEPSKSNGTQTGGDTTSQGTEPPKAGAPDTYTDFTAPEGTTLDKDAIAKAAPLFKELNLTQEQAQKLVTLTASRENDLAKSAKTAQEEAWNKTQGDWQREAKSEWGNRHESEVLPTIGRAIERLPESVRGPFREAMNLTGAGNNPAFIRVFYEMAKAQGEGTPVTGTPAPPPGSTTRPGWADSMYPNHPRQ